jgi:hypothetical protein
MADARNLSLDFGLVAISNEPLMLGKGNFVRTSIEIICVYNLQSGCIKQALCITNYRSSDNANL